MRLRTNILNHYPNANYTPYLKRGSEIEQPKSTTIFVGDLMYDKENNSIGIVLGCIDEFVGQELRLDSDGMRPIDKLRFALPSDFDIEGIDVTPKMKKELELYRL